MMDWYQRSQQTTGCINNHFFKKSGLPIQNIKIRYVYSKWLYVQGIWNVKLLFGLFCIQVTQHKKNLKKFWFQNHTSHIKLCFIPLIKGENLGRGDPVTPVPSHKSA
eukprot:TRINITY_DN2274_c2_g1_i1.p2 TRINITY_DN2274_c2_g1~~TRINITY_DN2274_c2_g1_i1.p2  ORF type:complete len:107 (+),score=1.87 TRINITY_DN2274_c2_g1_i1:333-653(+)